MSIPSLSVSNVVRPQSAERLRGIASMVAAVFVFSIMDALMKRVSGHYGPLQIACLRCVASLVCLFPMIAWQRSWASLKAAMPVLHVARACLGIGMLSAFVFAVHRLTLAQTYSLFLAAPLLMTALSVPMHKEEVSRRRWLAILIGMGGVLLILQPWSKGFVSLAAASAAALATVCYAFSLLTVRSLGRRNSSMSMVFWYLVLVSIGAGLLAVQDWRRIESEDWLWFAGIGITGALGQFWLTDAFRRAAPAVVAPFEYTAILWAFVIDWVFWTAAPTAGLVCGAAIVIASGIFVIWDERRLAGLPVNPACPPP